MNIWKVIFATLVIFGAGVLAGTLSTHRYHVRGQVSATQDHASNNVPKIGLWPRPSLSPAVTNAPSWTRSKNDFVERFGQQLELSSEQRVRIGSILGESQKRTKEISDSIAPQLREEVRHTRELIRAELTEAQQRRYDEIFRPKTRKKPEEKPVRVAPAPTTRSRQPVPSMVPADAMVVQRDEAAGVGLLIDPQAPGAAR